MITMVTESELLVFTKDLISMSNTGELLKGGLKIPENVLRDEKILHKFNPDLLIETQVLSDHFMLKHAQFFGVHKVMRKIKMTEEMIMSILHLLDHEGWKVLCETQELSEDFLRIHINSLAWRTVCEHQNLSESFIRDYKDKISWWYVSDKRLYSLEFYREFKDKIVWERVSYMSELNTDFIEEFKDRLSWSVLSSRYHRLTPEFMEKYQDYLRWDIISHSQILSPKTIIKFINKIHINGLRLNKASNLSESFMKSFTAMYNTLHSYENK